MFGGRHTTTPPPPKKGDRKSPRLSPTSAPEPGIRECAWKDGIFRSRTSVVCWGWGGWQWRPEVLHLSSFTCVSSQRTAPVGHMVADFAVTPALARSPPVLQMLALVQRADRAA